MTRAVLGALLLAALAGCTYVNETRPYRGAGYRAAPAPGYGYAAPGSYERERQAYEYGRRDGAVGR